MIFIIGGAASGKSAMGESICCDIGGRLLYVATMEPHGAEAVERIARHRKLRAGKGFHTVECARDLLGLRIESRYDAALLEDTGNLVANEMFGTDLSPEKVAEAILAGIDALGSRVGQLVIIGNDIFAGAERYTGDMASYLRCTGLIHREIAAKADIVIESVCGLPLYLKGGPQQKEATS